MATKSERREKKRLKTIRGLVPSRPMGLPKEVRKLRETKTKES